MKNFYKLFKENKKIALLPHENMDGDAVCSCLALLELAKAAGSSADIIVQDNVPENLRFLGGNFIRMTDGFSKEYGLAVAVDCGDESRMGTRLPIFKNAEVTAVIDHHVTNSGFADVRIISPDAAATCEIIYDVFAENNIDISKRAAECILGGILTDTGGFRYSNTSPKTMDTAAKLLKSGVDMAFLCHELLETVTLPQLRLRGAAADNAKFFSGGQTAVTYVSEKILKECGATEEDANNISSALRNIRGVRTSVSIRQHEGKLKVSMRSDGSKNVAEICARFGGGGHARAAGFTAEGDVQTLTAKILEAIGDYERDN